MKKYAALGTILISLFCVHVGISSAQTVPTLYNQQGTVVDAYDASAGALTAGWYYSDTGAPRYYYANGAYYDPSTQSYGGTVVYPNADGPSMSMAIFTPGVPNTGVGGRALTLTLALLVSAGAAVVGTYCLSRAHLI